MGMSGGVDSSVAAALLCEQGYEVIGVTMHLAGSDSRCCSLDDADDARRVADRLGIRFYVANYKDRFRSEVIEPFADAYLAGRTPIPCVACNRRFKFHHLLSRARALGAEAVATGHYAQRRPGIQEDDTATLWRGRDRSKDQSYFLFDLGPAELRHARFPVGGLEKDEVRERARDLGLATAEKPESQEICFVPDGDYARVVGEIRPGRLPGPGDLVDAEGAVLGRHPGIHHFTVGQRRGLGLPGGPWYVRRVEAATNRVVVGRADELRVHGAHLRGVRFTSGAAPEGPLRGEVQIRYRHAGAPAKIVATDSGEAQVYFEEPERAVAPGQAAVFYRGEQVLGGGWIEAPIESPA